MNFLGSDSSSTSIPASKGSLSNGLSSAGASGISGVVVSVGISPPKSKSSVGATASGAIGGIAGSAGALPADAGSFNLYFFSSFIFEFLLFFLTLKDHQ